MKFGLLCNSYSLQQWQIEALRHLLADGHECKLLIINANKINNPGFFKKLKTYPYSKFLIRFWYRYMLKVPSTVFIDARFLLQDVPSIPCSTSQKGATGYFSDEDVSHILDYKLDFILRFGFGIMKGKILEAARYGIWSFHHDDETMYRGVPTGFWEILFNDPVNAAILQKLTPTLDGGVILHKGYFGTVAHSWSGNLDKLLKSTVEWPARVCKQIENEGFPTHSEKQQTLSPLRFLPGNWVMFRFLLKTARNRLLYHLRDLFFSEHWQIGYRVLDGKLFNPQSESQIPDLQWVNIDLPSSVYLADPFGFCRNGIIHLLCEYYDYRNPKGKIVSIKIDASTNKILQQHVALEKDYHLAFPYLFEYEGDMYCLPENSAGGSVDLYKYDPESGKLVFEKTLIENLQAVDTVLFEYENRWWLLFTDRVSTNERLNIWFSGQLTGVYTPHPLNPVKTDIRSSRPAGQPFVRNGSLYRPAQDCSLKSGWRIAVNQIDTLTETSFSEHTVTQIEAPCLPSGLAGIHTFALSDNLLVADAKKEVFIAASFIRKFKQRIHKVLKINK